MDKTNIEQELQSIHQKLDFLTASMLEQQKKQREFDELKNDLAMIGKDIFDAAVDELDDISPHFDTGDMIHLLKMLLRNTRNMTRLLTQLESAQDFVQDLKPLTKQMFDKVLGNLNEMDRKGYFEFLAETIKIFDTIVTSFSVDDVRLLRENITSILLTVKGMTQPDILASMDNAVSFFRKMDIEVEEKISFFDLLKEMRKPEVKRGMLFMLEFVKNMAKSNHNHLQINPTP